MWTGKKRKIHWLFIFVISFLLNGCSGSKQGVPAFYSPSLSNPNVEISKEVLIDNLQMCQSIHPRFASVYSSDFVDSVAMNFQMNLPESAVRTTESVLLQRRLFDYFTFEDPHFRIIPQLYTAERGLTNKNIYVLPFTSISFGDTLLISESFSPILKSGDRIIEINHTSVADYLAYSYRDRYIHTPLLQTQFHFAYSNNYHLLIERGEMIKYMIVEGITLPEYYQQVQNRPDWMLYPSYLAGSFRIDEFKDNKKIVDELSSFLNKMKRLGYKNLVIDLRWNPGGSGDQIESLMALISSKRLLYYQKEVKVKLTQENFNKYVFPRDSLNKLVSLPDRFVINHIDVSPSSFARELKLYVLVSRNTGSMAACFANLIQYNDIGWVAGEPLLRNALKYGEVVEERSGVATFFISTVEYDDYTKAVDGVLFPDIMIPYKVNQFMDGGDPVMDQLLANIRFRQQINQRRVRF